MAMLTYITPNQQVAQQVIDATSLWVDYSDELYNGKNAPVILLDPAYFSSEDCETEISGLGALSKKLILHITDFSLTTIPTPARQKLVSEASAIGYATEYIRRLLMTYKIDMHSSRLSVPVPLLKGATQHRQHQILFAGTPEIELASAAALLRDSTDFRTAYISEKDAEIPEELEELIGVFYDETDGQIPFQQSKFFVHTSYHADRHSETETACLNGCVPIGLGYNGSVSEWTDLLFTEAEELVESVFNMPEEQVSEESERVQKLAKETVAYQCFDMQLLKLLASI